MRRSPLLLAALAAIAGLATGCDGVSAASGIGEPIVVRGAQFFGGPIPIPLGVVAPSVLTIDSENNAFAQGQAGKQLAGDAESGAMGIAVRFAQLGSGYWLAPVGSPDPQTPGALSWSLTCDFAEDIPVGKHMLLFAATDNGGNFGPINSLPVLAQSIRPTGKVVISLKWDSNADLDLHVRTPSGHEVEPKHPSLPPPPDVDGGSDAGVPGGGVIDRDANDACIADAFREEDMVFAGAPTPGTYQLRVDMFSACGAAAANFDVVVTVDGKTVFSQKGRLFDFDADGGGPGSGLYVGELAL